MQGDRALIEFEFGFDDLGVFEFSREAGEWKLSASHEVRDGYLWKHPDMDLPFSESAEDALDLDGPRPLRVELHADGRLMSGQVETSPQKLLKILRYGPHRGRALVRADRSTHWRTVARLVQELSAGGRVIFATFDPRSVQVAFLPRLTPFFLSGTARRWELMIRCWFPAPEAAVELRAVVELRGDVPERRYSELDDRAERLDYGLVLIDAGPAVPWEDVVRAIDSLQRHELPVLLAAPAEDGAAEPGIRLIEDPTGHPALERILRAKAD